MEQLDGGFYIQYNLSAVVWFYEAGKVHYYGKRVIFFIEKRITGGSIMNTRQRKDISDIAESANLDEIDIVMQKLVPVEWKSARHTGCERGFLRGFFLPLSEDSEKRKLLIIIFTCILNSRTHLVGLRQMHKTYAVEDCNKSRWAGYLIREEQ